MFTGEDKKAWAYRCLMRPPTPGAVPKDGLDEVDFREGETIDGHFFWGTVIYKRELTQGEIDHYDLCFVPFATVD